MGTDREARALGAGEKFEVDDKTYMLRPVVVQSLADLELEALQAYKRQYLETYKRNADLIDHGQDMLVRKLEEAAKWTVSDLPVKKAFDASNVTVNEGLKSLLIGIFDLKDEGIPERAMIYSVLLSMALDTGRITPDKVFEITGTRPREGRIRFDQWWVTAERAGMIAYVYCSLKVDYPSIDQKEVGRWPMHKLVEASRIVEKITAASMGNG